MSEAKQAWRGGRSRHIPNTSMQPDKATRSCSPIRTLHMNCGCSRALSTLVLVATTVAAGDVVERRSADPPLEGRVTLIDDAGVTVKSLLGAVHFVPWDRVRSVQTESIDMTLPARMQTAVDLWRARSRVERHDTTLAESLFARLFEQYRGKTHETALVVAEGLLRCRSARSDQVMAVIPALEVARLRRAGITTEAYSTLDPVLDSTYALCTVLPPVWLQTPRLDSLGHDLDGYDPKGDEVVGALANAYRQAVRQTLGRPIEPADRGPDHPGVELLRRLIACNSQSADERSAAREQLRRAIPSMPAWAEAWCRYQIGVSLLAETGLGRRQTGAVSLVHLPARFSRTQHFLAGLALAELIRTMHLDGDEGSADRLRNELGRSYPNHPLHDSGEADSQ